MLALSKHDTDEGDIRIGNDISWLVGHMRPKACIAIKNGRLTACREFACMILQKLGDHTKASRPGVTDIECSTAQCKVRHLCFGGCIVPRALAEHHR